jgi:hypothetical protein
MKSPYLRVFCAAALSCVVGAALADPDKDESGKGRERYGHPSEEKGWGWGEKKGWDDKKHRREGRREGDERRDSYFHRHGYTRLNIPPGHYPPPGECRIWYPDRPPGHQPPPGKCGSVPAGAWVIRHPRDHPGHAHVFVYGPQRPGAVLVVGEFKIASGAFVRIVGGY